MKTLLRPALLAATIAGLGVAIWTFGAAGIGGIVAIAERLGPAGFLLYCLYSLGVFAILGAAWTAATRGEGWRRIGRFTWARLIREAAADLLPFSQIGGIILSTRMLTAAGLPRTRVYASQIVDTTTELASQLVFTLYGLAMAAAIVAGRGTIAPLAGPAIMGMLAIVAIVALLLAAQRWLLPLAGRIGQHLLPGLGEATAAIEAELRATYADRRRVLRSFAINLAGWIASAAGAWIALRLMGIAPSLWTVLAIESLIFTLRSAAFAVPAGIGVQEAGYALCAPLLGLAPEAALALALAKRARDLAIALPTLLVWQAIEARGIGSHRSGATDDAERR